MGAPTVGTTTIPLFSPSDTATGALIIADPANTAAILVSTENSAFGANGTGNYVPLNANGSIFVPPGFRGTIYGQAASGTQTFRVVAGDSNRLLSLINPGSTSTISLGSVSLLTGTNAIGSVKVTSLVTVTEIESLAPTSIPASTAETIEVTGTTALSAGELISFSLACEVGAAIAGQGAVYVAIKGATSAKYYAVAVAGTAVAGQIYAGSAEKLNIVAANGDATDAHVVSGTWEAVT